MMIETPSATSAPDLLGEPEVDRRVRARARLSVFLRRKSLLVGGALLLLILVLVIGAPLFTGYDPTAQDPNAILQGPSPSHIMGTDQLGRDIFARVLYGGRYTLLASVLAVLIGALLGTGLGLLAGFFGGIVENAGMRLVDFLLAFPGILLALAITTVLGPGLGSAIIAIGISSLPTYGRVIHGVTLQARTLTYVEAATALGVSTPRLLRRHILPNMFLQVVVLTTTGLGIATLWVAALGFLGLGLQPPTPEWGSILNDGRDYVTMAWWVSLFPGILISLYVIGVNLVGDGLHESVDPTASRM
jgi:ABC-type dipeptide/oligopeptide/nickel transport system permease subunit